MMSRLKGAAIYAGIVIAVLAVSRFFFPAFLLLLLFVLLTASGEMRKLSTAGKSWGYVLQFRTQGISFIIPLLYAWGIPPGGDSLILYPDVPVLTQENVLRALLVFILWQFFISLILSLARIFRAGSSEVSACYLISGEAFSLSLALFSAAMILYSLKYGWLLLCLAILTPWISDSAAWFVGRNWGKRKAFPGLSPNKTVAGVMGALLGTALFYLFVSLLLTGQGCSLGEPWYGWMIGGVIASMLAQAGDLWESAQKRQAGVKDSGHMIPGHGGVLDRIDSSLTLMPVFFICFLLLR